MSTLHFTETELAAAVARGVRQCVVIGDKQPPGVDSFPVDLFAINPSQPLSAELEKSNFDRLKASLFVWLGDAGYRTVDSAIATLAFIASLPKGSGVVFDYAVERTSIGSMTQTALDAFASRFSIAGGGMKYLIQPQAVAVLLRGLGFRQIVDLVEDDRPLNGGHLVSALV